MDFKFNINSSFDSSEVIKGLQEIRQQMGKLSADSSIFGNIDKEFEKVQKAFTDLSALDPLKTSAKGSSQYIKTLDNLLISFGRIEIEMTDIAKNSDLAFDFKEVAEARQKIENLKTSLTTYTTQLKNAQVLMKDGLGSLGLSDRADEIKSEQDMIKVLTEEYQLRKNIYEQLKQEESLKKSSAGAAQARVSVSTSSVSNKGSFDTKSNAAGEAANIINTALKEGIATSKSFSDIWKNITTELSNSGIELNNLEKIQNDIQVRWSKGSEEVQKIDNEIKTAKASMEQLGTAGENGQIAFSQLSQNAITAASNMETASKNVKNTEEQIDAAVQESAAAFAENSRQLSAMIPQIQEAGTETKNLIQNEKDLAAAEREAAVEQENFGKKMASIQSWVTNILSLTNGWRQFQQIVKQTFTDVQKLDKAFASIAMVTDQTVSGLWSTYDQYAEMANRLGQTTESAIKASALFYQQGLNTSEALSLTEDTMKLATLAGADFETATQQMTAALRGFHMEMDEGSKVTDVYSELAANAAADVNGIAYAMSKTASIASNAGMDFETTAAFLTNMIETTQEAPENIGTAMKTIIARFTELKENVSAADSEFDDLDYNKVDKALKSIGVSLKDSQGQFKDLDDVFLELSSKWDTLDRNTQRYIATIAAGSRQQSRFIAMMEDYDRTMELVTTAQDSAGRSEEQFAKYQDTLGYKINQLKNSWEQLRTTFLDSSIYKGAIDGITSIVNKIQNLDFKKLLVSVIAVTPIIKSLIQNFISGISNAGSELQKAGQLIGKKITEGIGSVSSGIASKFIKFDPKEIAPSVEAVKKKLDEIQKKKEEIQTKKMSISINTDRLKSQIAEAKAELDSLVGVNTKEAQQQTDALVGKIANLESALASFEPEMKDLEADFQILEVDEKSANQELEILNAKLQDFEMRSQGVTNGLTQIGSAATVMAGALFSGASVTDSLNLAIGTLASDGISSLMQLIPQLVTQIMTKKAAVLAAETAEAAEAKAAAAVKVGAAAESIAAMKAEEAAAKQMATTTKAAAIEANAAIASTGIGLFIIGLGTALAFIAKWAYEAFKKYQASHKTLEQQVAEAQEKAEELKKLADEAESQAKTSEETVANTKKLQESYDELSKKVVKTTEEQEEYNNIVSQIKDQFPEIITKYNEITGELEIQRDLWDQILERQKLSAQRDNNKAYSAKTRELSQEQTSLNLQRQQTDQDYQEARYGSNVDRKNLGMLSYRETNDKGFLTGRTIYLDNSSESMGKAIYEHAGGDRYDFIDTRNTDYINALTNFEQAFAKQLNLDLTNQVDFKRFGQVLMSGTDATLEEYKQIFGDDAEEKYNLLEIYRNTLDTQKANQDDYLDNQQKIIDEEKRIYFQDNLVNNGMNEDKASWAARHINNEGSYKDLSKSRAEKEMNGVHTDTYEDTSGNADLRAALSQMGINNEAEYKAWVKQLPEGEDIKENLTNVLKDYYMQGYAQTWIEDLSGEDTQNLQKADSLAASGSLEEMDAFLDSLDKETTIYTDIEQVISGAREQIESSIKEVSAMTSTGQDFFKSWDQEELNAYQQKAQSIIDEMGSNLGGEYLKGLNKIFEENELSPEQINNVLNQVNWDNLDLNNQEEFRQQTLDLFQELGIEGGSAFYSQLAEYNQKYGKYTITLDEEGFENLKKDVEDLDTKVWGLKDTFIDVAKKGAEGATLTADEYSKIEAALTSIGQNVDDFIQIDESGKASVINAEALMRCYENNLDYAERELQQKKKALIVSKKQLEVSIAELKTEIAKNMANGGPASAEAGRQMSAMYAQLEQLEGDLKTLNTSIKDLDDEEAQLAKNRKLRLAQVKSDWEDTLDEVNQEVQDSADNVTEKEKAVADALDDLQKKQKAVQDAWDDLVEKEQNVIDKTDELNKALYGDLHKNKLDFIYNYTIELDKLTKKASEAKSALEKMQDGDDADALWNQYTTSMHDSLINRKAQNVAYESGIQTQLNAIQNELPQMIAQLNAKHGSNMDTDISKYIVKNGDTWGVNFGGLNSAALANGLSDYIETAVETLNSFQTKIDDNNSAIRAAEKELMQMRKSALERTKNRQEEIAGVMKEEAQKEVDIQKEKYQALKDADDDYLNALEEAIQKQRNLRQQQNDQDELATKEKKLSLMQRDTSGANQKEIMTLENDIQDNREQLLDNSINDIIDNMKELYDLQAETREMELEYQQELLDTINYMKLAEDLLNSFESAEEYVAWMVEHNAEDIRTATQAETELLLTNWGETGDQMVADTEILNTNIKDIMNVSNDEVVNKVATTSDAVQYTIETDLKKIVDDTDIAISSAETSLKDAIKEVQEARDDYKDALAELQTAQQDLDSAQSALDAALAENESLLARMKEIQDQTNVNLMSKDALIAALYEEMGVSANYMMESTSDQEIWKQRLVQYSNGFYHFADGGLVDFTGPAWVDGSHSSPEAFLSPEDTERIGRAAQLLADLPLLSSAFDGSSVNNGESLIEVHINIEKIGDEVDLDNALDKMKTAIWEASNPAGSSVILSK